MTLAKLPKDPFVYGIFIHCMEDDASYNEECIAVFTDIDDASHFAEMCGVYCVIKPCATDHYTIKGVKVTPKLRYKGIY